MQLGGRPLLCRAITALLRRQRLELLVQAHAMAQHPRVLPHAIRASDINVLVHSAISSALLEALGRHGTKVFGKDAPAPQHAVAVGRKVHGGTGFVCEAGLFIELELWLSEITLSNLSERKQQRV